MNRPITSKGTELVNKQTKSHEGKSPGPSGFLVNSTNHFKN